MNATFREDRILRFNPLNVALAVDVQDELVAPVLVALVLGGWLGSRLVSTSERAWLSLVLGMAVLVLVGLIPFLGSLVITLVCIAGLGAAVVSLKRRAAAAAW